MAPSRAPAGDARILGRRGTAGRLGGDALALWAGVDAAEAGALAASVRSDVHSRFSADGVTVDVALGSAPGAPGNDVAALLHAAVAALEQARTAGRAPQAA